MMDWIRFLDDHHIEYVTRGPNTKKGEVSVQCPYCGEDDPSQHMGINLTAEKWGCHRNQSHRGKLPTRLITALLGCSQGRSKIIAAQYSAADPEDLDQALVTLVGLEGAISVTSQKLTLPNGLVELPREFKAINRNDSTGRFWRYLERRGFDGETHANWDTNLLIETYELKCCTTGRWKDRIIIPIYQNNRLICWTSRAIQKSDTAPRYLSNSDSIKNTVFNEDVLRHGGHILFITEGPFDAMKVDFYGQRLNCGATCTFGTSVSVDQISILTELCRVFVKTVLLFDPEAVSEAFNLSEWLQAEAVELGQLPDGVEDPGNLTKQQVEDLVKKMR